MNYDYYTLANGVRIILVPMQGVQSVGIGVYVETGSRYETPKINGISHFLEHMVFKGTKNFPTHYDTSRLEGMGAVQNAWTDVDATAYWCKIPADKWQEGLALMKDLALYPTIPRKDLEIERGVILEEINRRDDRPDEISAETMMELKFAPNTLGMTILGNPDVIKRVSRDDFLEYHDHQYVAGRIVVVMAGKIVQPAKIKHQISDYFEKLPKNPGGDFEKIKDVQSKPMIKLYKKDLAAQAHIQLGVSGVTVDDPRRFGLSLLTTYLGHGLSSRLFVELREKRGLCYAVSTEDSRWTDSGLWSVYAGLAIDKLEDAVLAIATEMHRLKDTKLTEEELIQAKEKIRGPLLFSAENPVNVMNYYAKQALDRPENIMSYDAVIDSLMQIDSSEIMKITNELFVQKKLNLAVVGPVSEDRVQKLMERVKI
jgi:predicted Zn-dependent peptidase